MENIKTLQPKIIQDFIKKLFIKWILNKRNAKK